MHWILGVAILLIIVLCSAVTVLWAATAIVNIFAPAFNGEGDYTADDYTADDEPEQVR